MYSLCWCAQYYITETGILETMFILFSTLWDVFTKVAYSVRGLYCVKTECFILKAKIKKNFPWLVTSHSGTLMTLYDAQICRGKQLYTPTFLAGMTITILQCLLLQNLYSNFLRVYLTSYCRWNIYVFACTRLDSSSSVAVCSSCSNMTINTCFIWSHLSIYVTYTIGWPEAPDSDISPL